MTYYYLTVSKVQTHLNAYILHLIFKKLQKVKNFRYAGNTETAHLFSRLKNYNEQILKRHVIIYFLTVLYLI